MNIESKKNLHVDDVFRNDISFDFIHCTQSKNSIIQHRDNQIPKVRDNRKCQVTVACDTVCVLKVKKKKINPILPPAMAVFLRTVTVTAVVAITILPAVRATKVH